MSNPIKYSTGSESLALKKGNFYIGTGDVGKGPTSTTGYYNGITPPSGGYTIYLNKATGGPSIYTCANDTELVSLTNSIAGASYTTVNECLVYFAGQSDKMVLNRDYEGIVTDGLVFNLDAGSTISYPRNGNTWYDLSGNGNHGTLINSPSFSTDNGGGIVFDGSNDSVQLYKDGVELGFVENSFSVTIWYNADNTTNNAPLFSSAGGGYRKYLHYVLRGHLHMGFYSNDTSNGSPSTNTTYCASFVYDSSALTQKIYVNGSLNATGSSKPPLLSGGGDFKIGGRYSGWYDGKIFQIMAHSKALTSEEVLQNYNAQKGRFGL